MAKATGTVRIATAQYNVSALESWHDYERKINSWIKDACANRAQLLLFPEYFSMELVSLFDETIQQSLPQQLTALQSLLQGFQETFASLARKNNIYILAGTFPVQQGDDYHNRAFLFSPDGVIAFQDKLLMTRFENEHWLIKEGNTVRVFDTSFGRVGVLICYDSEFPMIARQQVEQGANLLLVPSCTDTLAGYNRVRIGCQARALENQCYVVQACTVGEASWSEAINTNIGAAGVYTPVDCGFSDDGVLAGGELNKAGWVYADLDLAAIANVREQGQVFNYRDWPSQFEKK